MHRFWRFWALSYDTFSSFWVRWGKVPFLEDPKQTYNLCLQPSFQYFVQLRAILLPMPVEFANLQSWRRERVHTWISANDIVRGSGKRCDPVVSAPNTFQRKQIQYSWEIPWDISFICRIWSSQFVILNFNFAMFHAKKTSKTLKPGDCIIKGLSNITALLRSSDCGMCFWHHKKHTHGNHIVVSKKSPTGPTERTPKPEYLISLAPYLGVRW